MFEKIFLMLIENLKKFPDSQIKKKSLRNFLLYSNIQLLNINEQSIHETSSGQF